MSQIEKLLLRIKNNPKTVRFDEIDKLLIRAGFVKRQSGKGTSHYYYTKDDKILSIPHRKPHVLECYVKEVIKLIGNYFENEGD